MKTILIDARNSGTSTGRYTDKLIEHLYVLKPDYNFIIVTTYDRLGYFKKIAPDFKAVPTPYKEFSLGEQIGFKKHIKSLNADLVHFPIVQQPIFYHGKVVTSMLDLTTLHFRNPAANPLVFIIKQQVYRFVNYRAARKSKQIICITDYWKGEIVRFARISASKITTIYLAADKIVDAAQPIKELRGTKFIMYVGRPQPHKNLGRLIDAFVLLQPDFPDLKLVLVGKKDSVYEQHVKRVEGAGIKNVMFTGFTTEAELRWLYENTAAYVFPSLSEGFGLPALEAMIHGAPVVSSNATCLPEVYGDAAEYFNPTDVQDMATSVKKVISDEKTAKNLSLKGKSQAARYSWSHNAQQTLGVYKKALSE